MPSALTNSQRLHTQDAQKWANAAIALDFGPSLMVQFDDPKTLIIGGFMTREVRNEARRVIRAGLWSSFGVFIAVAIWLTLLVPSAYSQGNDYPFQGSNYNDADPYDFYYLNCTSFVAWRMNRDAGAAAQTPPWFRDGMQNGHWGNAFQWSANARAIGYTVDNVPAVGAIAPWEVNECGGCSSGHVAYVESVNSDNSVNLSEYNYCTAYGFDNRSTVNCNGTGGAIHPPRFIHIVSAQPVTVTSFFQNNANGQYTITCPTDNLVDASFQLINHSSSSVFFSQVAMAIHLESTDAFVADVAIQNNVTIPGGGTYSFPRSFLSGANPSLVPGNYRLVAKVYNGAWIELALHLPFTILSRSNNCGAQSSPEVASLTSVPQQASWVYYQNNSLSQWYISENSGVTYLLSGSSGYSGELVWGTIANGSPVATVNWQAQTVYVSPSASAQTSATSYSGITIAGGQNITVSSSRGYDAAQQISGQTMSQAWYFFQVQSTGIWYIVNLNGTATVVYRLRLKPDNSDYDWLQISDSSWKRSFSGTASGVTITLSNQ